MKNKTFGESKLQNKLKQLSSNELIAWDFISYKMEYSYKLKLIDLYFDFVIYCKTKRDKLLEEYKDDERFKDSFKDTFIDNQSSYLANKDITKNTLFNIKIIDY